MIVVLRFSDLIIDLFMLNSKLLRIIITITNDLTAATEMIPFSLEVHAYNLKTNKSKRDKNNLLPFQDSENYKMRILIHYQRETNK